MKQVGRELGVRYLLEGSVRKAGPRVRITGQLIDALTGTHLWADRFDGSLEDVFELQDKVASSVAGIIEPTLRTAEIRRSVQWPTLDLTAYDFYLRALPNRAAYDKDHTLSALSLYYGKRSNAIRNMVPPSPWRRKAITSSSTLTRISSSNGTVSQVSPTRWPASTRFCLYSNRSIAGKQTTVNRIIVAN